MPWSNTEKLIKFPVVLTTLGMLVFGFFCVGLFHKMPMEEVGATSMVSMQVYPSCCSMGISQHIDSWKLLSQSLPRDARDIITLFALGLITLVARWRPLLARKFSEVDLIAYSSYLRRNPGLINFHHLKLAFAKGILNPKVY